MRSAASDGPPLDPALLLTDPHAAYDRLRGAGPVHRIPGPDGSPAWLVTRHDDVRRLLADPRLSLDKRNSGAGNYRGFALPPALDANLLNMDPPDHTRLRRLVTKAFTARRTEELRGPVQRIADELLDAIEPLGRADLISSYAAPLPISVICELLGIPPGDRADFRAWSDALITPDPARPEGMKQAIGEMVRFVGRLIARKRAHPADDLISGLIAARDGGDRLSEDELTSLVFLILFAGYENTVHLIGNATLALLEHPEQLRALRADPSRLPAAVEELVRFDGPAALAIRRFPVEDVEIGGTAIPAGETVLLSLASAGRDPRRFADPHRLDLSRAEVAHLAFGHGIHHCLGAPLARLEAGVALGTLLRRLPGLALGVPREELAWRPTIRARGLVSLPVTY
ncbi:cytochrome P450 family protein [Nonomuraea jiangxiensis]|uniref:Cytochrome P450 n=1 Tax=Nonomuraea jiangxiensis TaxID=633440 RepID=A0A1G8ILR3_9ACTN|nr:cytochrome P450 [Nonomuraea jiangxiensis]SDI19909.1 Cytochrome P450 [Nonomuraea jiangxiensis]